MKYKQWILFLVLSLVFAYSTRGHAGPLKLSLLVGPENGDSSNDGGGEPQGSQPSGFQGSSATQLTCGGPPTPPSPPAPPVGAPLPPTNPPSGTEACPKHGYAVVCVGEDSYDSVCHRISQEQNSTMSYEWKTCHPCGTYECEVTSFGNTPECQLNGTCADPSQTCVLLSSGGIQSGRCIDPHLLIPSLL